MYFRKFSGNISNTLKIAKEFSVRTCANPILRIHLLPTNVGQLRVIAKFYEREDPSEERAESTQNFVM